MKTLLNNLLIIGITSILLIFLVSCSSSESSVVSNTPSSSGEGTEEQSGVAKPIDTAESQPVDTKEISSTESEVPEDLPIMPGARRLTVTSEGTNISYEVDGNIDDVVAFYQEELPGLGWEMTRTPDNALAAMGTMARVNEKGDRLAISLQYNPMAEFVVARIFISRVP